MIYSVRGELIILETCMAVIECAGVGYRLNISGTTQNTLPSPGTSSAANVLLYTYMSVREDAVELFGFSTREELSTFKMLISVSGIGPKAAMSILTVMTPEQFALAVISEDTKAISKAPGVGAKSAARVVLELKDKLGGASAGSAAKAYTAASSSGGSENKLSEAQNALIVLGYSRAEAVSAIRSLKTDKMELEEIIKSALAVLSKL